MGNTYVVLGGDHVDEVAANEGDFLGDYQYICSRIVFGVDLGLPGEHRVVPWGYRKRRR